MSESSALNLRAGDIVGGYTLVSRLGGGAMGSVWKIQDDGGNIYAMKILRDSLSDEQNAAQQDSQDDNLTARERLRREAMALQKIRHPGICNIVDMELDDAIAFIVTELIDGTTLREDVEKHGKYVGDDLERLTKKLVSAVQAVHNAGIIHRDIKPTNVMISAKGPVLVDFGIAMSEGESHVTRTGLVMGTPGFIAPEIINGSDSSEATDWWSLSSVLAFAATGKPVFGTKPMMAVLEREASGNAQLTGLPPHTMQAFRAALDPNTHKRISPQQLLEAISYDTWNNNFQKIDDEDHNQGEVMPPFRLNSQDDQDITNAPNSEHTQNVIPKTQVAQSLGNFQTTATVPNFIDTTASADNNTEELSGINNLETALMPSFAEAMQSDTRLLNTNPRKIWEDDLENENSNEYINHTTVFPNQYSPEPSTTALENNPQTSGMPTAARKLYPIQEQNIPGFEPNSVQAENSPNAPVLATPEEISQQYSAYAKRGTICQYALTPFIACLGAQY
ncbi:MAG: serine/threonine-protein kinase, partial [Bifidobacteriaceae bacterium]|nr:serine/threonine-protein kinase [Bifidobacteriaceae bacterium]